MTVTIDGKSVEVSSGDTNIIDVARRAKIGIPDPCHRSSHGAGCCRACVIEVNGAHAFACSTKPLGGMRIIVNRADLNALRKERLGTYRLKLQEPRSGNGGACDCAKEPRGCC